MKEGKLRRNFYKAENENKREINAREKYIECKTKIKPLEK